MDGKVGGRLEDTDLVPGIVIDKDMSHPQVGIFRGRCSPLLPPLCFFPRCTVRWHAVGKGMRRP